ncbi:MAG: ATP-binding cassette domain-containing protein, partial [Planctomycetales bacterium]
GPSGCGKTTLLSVIGLLRHPTNPQSLTRFTLNINEPTKGDDASSTTHDLRDLWVRRQERRIERLRRQYVGFALQSGELLPSLTVRENIAVPLRLAGFNGRQRRERVDELLAAFHLTRVTGSEDDPKASSDALANSRVNRLSGGEYQRVSLARAIAHRPQLVFVDEPTAALNREMAHDALVQFRDLQQQSDHSGATIMITHDESLAEEFATLVVRMAPVRGRAAGEVVEITRHAPEPADAVDQPDDLDQLDDSAGEDSRDSDSRDSDAGSEADVTEEARG